MNDVAEKRRREVLVAFHTACPRPSAAEIADWVGRHPEWADDIRIHAEGALADPGDKAGSEEPSSGLVHRTRAMAFATLKAARGNAATDATTFDRLLARVGLDVPMLAEAVGLGRGCVFRRSRPGIPISSRPPIRREAGHRSDLKPATAAAFPQVREEGRVGGVSGQAG